MISHKKERMFKKIDETTERALITYSEQLMTTVVRFTQLTDQVTLHKHPEEQMTYVINGKLKFFIEEQAIIATAGDVLHFKPNQLHGCIVLEAGSQVLDTFTPARKDFLTTHLS